MNVPWLLVAGDLTPLGGMDRANHALARHLGANGAEVHLVTHRAWPDLTDFPSVTLHKVWRPFNRHLFGSPLLARTGRHVWRGLAGRGAKAIVNGGNCDLAGANWVHYLHAAYEPPLPGSLGRRTKALVSRRRDVEAERVALADARVIIANSQRTKRDIVEHLGLPESRIHVIYYGSDPAEFSYVDDQSRRAAKQAFGFALDRPLLAFVGALGDRRKAFDAVFDAVRLLSGHREWDVDLIVAGTGAELPAWRARTKAEGLAGRIQFLGFRSDVPELLAACDALVHPARYEAYGLSVHEALCRGIPALVSARSGVAERYPASVSELLIQDPENAAELSDRLLTWRQGLARFRDLVGPVSAQLRSRTWDSMAGEIEAAVERAA